MRIALLSGLIGLLLACSVKPPENKGHGNAPPALVSVYLLKPVQWSEQIASVGTGRAKESTVISAKQSERIAAVHFESGQHVQKGQLLVELDAGTVRAELAEAQANLSDLNAQVTRLQNLQAKQLIAKSQLDTTIANRNAAYAKVQGAQERLHDRQIRAPFSGVLGLRQISVGQFVNAGFAMVNLDDLSLMSVDFPVPESLLAQLQVSQTIVVQSDAFPSREFLAKVSSIDSRVDVSTRAIMVRASLANTDELIRSGMLLRVSLQQASKALLVVPELAVQQVGNRSFVYKIMPDQTVRAVDVRLGGRQQGQVSVVEGLKAGEQIVLDGTSKLRDGMAVKLSLIHI
jgi:membrane fusion protein (multidrug efflux system)